MLRTWENTLAMAIGKFNFSSLKEASEIAAWIFFAFSSKLGVKKSCRYFHSMVVAD